MFISKTASISRPLIINKISSHSNTNECKFNKNQNIEYFYLGLPPNMPISPEGSIICILDISFLYDNLSSFSFGSIGDSGGVLHGYCPQIPKEKFEETKLKKSHFLELMSIIANQDLFTKLAILQKKPTYPIIERVRHLISPIVADCLAVSTTQDRWAIEFSLLPSFNIEPVHIRNLFIPNTYLYNKTFRTIKRRIGKRLVTYNPKHPVLTHANTPKYLYNWML